MSDNDYEEDDEFYDEDEGDCLLRDEGLYGEMFARGRGDNRDYERDMSCDGFPPKISSYVRADTHNQLEIVFNCGRDKAWQQAMQEITYFRDTLGYGGNAELCIFNHLFGNDSTLFRKWKDITKNKGSSYAEFCKFIATFFFECSFSKTYSWLCGHPNVDTSHYLDQKRYNELWRIIDEYNKSEDYENRAWEEFESAFNEVSKSLLLPKHKEFVVDMVIDDDKQWYNNTERGKDVPLDENMTLARTLHVRDNARGLTLNASCYTVTNMPLHLRYKRESESEQLALQSMIEFLFRRGVDLSGLLKLAMDRRYWSAAILKYILSIGAEIHGTWKRQSIYPWTYGRKDPNDEIEDIDKPHNINTSGPMCVFQTSATHNFGKTSNRDHNLTAILFRSGYSSTPAMMMQSDPIESTASNRTILDCIVPTKSAQLYDHLSRKSHNDDGPWNPEPETINNNNDDDDINDDDSGPVWGTAEEFMNPFFCHNYCDKFEQVRKEEAADLIPFMKDSFIEECLNMIDGAPKPKTPEIRQHTLLKWTQSTRPKRLILFMTKKQLEDLADSLGLANKMSWTGNMTKLKNRLANLINDLQYDGLDGDAEDDDMNVTSNDSSYHAAFLETSFMSKLKAGGDEGQTKYQRFGHRAEKERLDEFFDIYNVVNPPGHGIEALYQPGLVHRKGSFWIRDSSDGVALMEGGGVVPIEVKSQCSNRTYQRERQNIQAHSRCKLYSIDSNDVIIADVFSHMEIDDNDGGIGPVNPLLQELIPNSRELIQILHHAVTYRARCCFLLIGSSSKLMTIYRVIFDEILLDAYMNICVDFYRSDLHVFYVPGKNVPEIPQVWMDALSSSSALCKLNMDEESFLFNVGIWRKFNIPVKRVDDKGNEIPFYDDEGIASLYHTSMQELYPFPLPIIERLVPLIVSMWNAKKGGGDTCTKLIDSCKERIGIRTQTTTACARILLYYGVQFHRLCQWTSGKKDIKSYASATHARNSNSHRTTYKDSLTKASNMLLSQARSADLNISATGLDSEEGNTLHFDALVSVASGSNDTTNNSRKSTRNNCNKTPTPIKFPYTATKTGTTPSHRKADTDVGYTALCDNCIGMIYGRQAPDPDVTSVVSDANNKPSSSRKSTRSSQGKNSTTKSIDTRAVRRQCSICQARTDWYCTGCKRYLCNLSPKADPNNKKKKGNVTKKYPKFYVVDSPVLDDNGNMMVGRDKALTTNREVGHLSCYLIAHQKGFNAYAVKNRQTFIDEGRKRKRRESI